MPTILLGIVVLVLVLWGLNGLTKADPRGLARGLRWAGGLAMVAVGAFLLMRGQFEIGLPLGVTGLSVLGWLPWKGANIFQRTQKSAGQTSRVRAAFVEMELDHDTGAMRGRILAGKHEGVTLDALDVATIEGYLPQVDAESRALLEAYLDRREPAWRDHVQGDAAARNSRAPSSGKMTPEEAYQILGVQPGASADEIGRAHRSLMKKLHPDQGGSTYLAARVNEAKDILLRRHR